MKKRIVEIIILIGFGICLEESAVNMGKNNFYLEAHRGWSEYYPENTLVAFEAAGQCEAFDAIETDVQETLDGVLVLFHDNKLDKKTDATGKILEYTFDEVKEIKIDAVKNIEKNPEVTIPTLEEYLEICKKYNKIPYIEMKTMTDAGIEKLISVLDTGGWQEKCVLTTFRYENLVRVREITNVYQIEYMVPEKFDFEEVLGQILCCENIVFRPSAYAVTQEMVEVCKNNGIEVECYGLEVGDVEKYNELKKMGIKGVTCNDWKGIR